MSILGIRRAKLDVLHDTDTHHSSPGVTVSILGIRRAKLDVLHATDHCLCACHLEHCGGAAVHVASAVL